MSGERLRAELERIAEGAPRVDVPRDLYARGRRATARARILATSAAVACVVLLVAVVAPALAPERPHTADGSGGTAVGVPSRIHAVPTGADRATELSIGLGAAAFVTADGIPVVVDAETGGYHVLDLDGLLVTGSMPHRATGITPPVALSPDGRHLAWGWLENGGRTRSEAGSGIRIADLETGAIREIRLDDGTSTTPPLVLVNQVSWSADGRWLVWGGTRIVGWTDNSFSLGKSLGGTVGPGADVTDWLIFRVPSTELGREITGEPRFGEPRFVVAVANTGELTAVVGNVWWQIGNRVRLQLRTDQRVASLWFDDGRLFALVHGADDSEVREMPGGRDQAPFPLATRPSLLGVVGDGTLLIHQESLDEAGPPPVVELVASDAAGGEVDARTIIEVDPGVLGLTLATELIDPEQPTVSRPAPDWTTSTERKVAAGELLLIGVVVAGGVVGAGAWVRRRRLSSR